MIASDEALAAIRAVARAALERGAVDSKTVDTILGDIVSRCRELPQYEPALPQRRPPRLVMTRKAQTVFIESVARDLLADTAKYIGELTQFFVANIADLELKLASAQSVSKESENG